MEEGLRLLHNTPELQDMFGDLFLRAYAAVKLDEFEEFNQVISSWEAGAPAAAGLSGVSGYARGEHDFRE